MASGQFGQTSTIPNEGGHMAQTNQVQMVGTQQQPVIQTVVVVQQQPATQTIVVNQAQVDGNRYGRWNYLIFGIGVCIWQFAFFIFTTSWVLVGGPLSGLFFICGVVPSLMILILMISDSTVFCANPMPNKITKICCCECISGPAMAVPMAIAALLRFILWCALFGIVADLVNSFDDSSTSGTEEITKIFFWIFLAFVSIDCGPLICLSIDWWWYYGKHNYDALFGVRFNPLRCVVGMGAVICVHCWALIAVTNGTGLEDEIWVWTAHGLLATAVLIFGAFVNFSGSLNGPNVSNAIYRWIFIGFGIFQCVLFLIVWGYILSVVFEYSGLGGLVFYGLYYTALTVPWAWALFSFKVGPAQSENPV